MMASPRYHRYIAFLLLSLCSLSVKAADLYVSTSFHEPATEGLRFIYSHDGLRWDSIEGVFLRPEVGSQKVMRDPSIVRGPDGTFHLVWTSSWRGDRGFGYSSSKDLIHWTTQRFISTGMDSTTVNTWAPELFYDDVKRQFIIVWASCVPGRFPDYQEDPKNNHRLYYMTTRDFRRFSKAQLFYDPGFSVIDATLVSLSPPKGSSSKVKTIEAPSGAVGGASYVMVLKDNSRPMRNIKVAFASTPYGPWSTASEPFTESFTEGPSTAKVGDWWYIYYDSYQHKIYGAHRTKDFKTFQDQTGAVSFPVGHKHGTVFMAPEELVEGLIKYNRDVVHYSGKTIARPERHDGGLKPVVGIHTIQTMRGGTVVGHTSQRASNEDATLGGVAHNWTYNHQPMLTYWQGRFWLHFLTDPRHEHEAPGKTMLQTSPDGYSWTAPTELFPEYPVPEGWTKEGKDFPPAHNLKAVMHQRVGWYGAPDANAPGTVAAPGASVLLATGSYGICLTMKDDPNDGNGIGRVVRRVFEDGTLGPIYFVYYNHGFSPRNTVFPYYKSSKDKAFVAAVDQMLADPMQRMQWVEEADRNDPLIPLTKPYKAFSGYTLPDGRKVALWKHAVTSLSADGGNTWRLTNVDGKLGCDRAPGFVNSNAKIWGQRLSDGTYATVYNPSEYRWPLAISLSADGLDYTTLSLVNGEVTPLRHGGQYKSYGPQYVRGIEAPLSPPEGGTIGSPSKVNTIEAPSGAVGGASPFRAIGGTPLWVTYSNNKEDIWVSRIPVPVRLNATAHASGSFSQYKDLADMTDWNLYSPLLAPVALDGQWLTLSDSDPYDYAKAERIIPNTKELRVEFDLRFDQADHGELNIEFVDDEGNVCSRIVADSTRTIRVKGGARYGTLLKRNKPDMNMTYHITAILSCSLHRATYTIESTDQWVTMKGIEIIRKDKKNCTRQFDTPVESISRIVFRTGPLFKEPNTDTPADQDFDQPLADALLPQARFSLANVVSSEKTIYSPPSEGGAGGGSALLNYDSFAHYADRFNAMEDENIVTTIPNAQSSEWMRANIPLFDCPDEQMREMYYYRWWTLRKHIKRTPAGYGMTEFLVPRSYADRYNLIACAIGHHVMECRWLRDTTYLHQILRTWYFGNDGQAMTKMNKFSSWNPYAVQQLFKVEGDTAFLLSLKPRLEEEYARWERTNRLPSGLYWQGDVQDGMEESISGGRKKQYARPTINSYMYGNAEALAWMNAIEYDIEKTRLYKKKANELRHLICEHLWNPDHQFFETRRGDISDTLAQVREAIGYLPWYFNMWTGPKYDVAWQQLLDEQGFSAPYGLTTAERRHPEFRSHGVGKCEWDGAIWPFATSQTLTALANYLEAPLSSSKGKAPLSPPEGGTIDSPSKVKTIEAPSGAVGGASPSGAGGEALFFHQMQLYTESQHHRGRPYIGEYLDEKTGAWLMGDRERSRYYNHSTYNDLIITGICGLRPQEDGSIVVNPLIATQTSPTGRSTEASPVWPWFCLDGIRYRDHTITIIWDEDGQHYHQGRGLTLMVDGQPVVNRKDLEILTYNPYQAQR